MSNGKKILVLNPGSTSTKLAVYVGEECLKTHNLNHSAEEVKKYAQICDQKYMRLEKIYQWLNENDCKIEEFQGVVGRGGLLRPMPGGTYKVTDKMLEDLKIGIQGQHASNLGGIMAHEIAKKVGIPSFIVDPVAVDEVEDVARISGMSEIIRKSLVHALNVKAVVRRVCLNRNLDYNKSRFVVAHIGGGITVSPVENGRILDCNNANEDGPFSPERAGGVPVGDLVKMCFSGKYSEKEVYSKLVGKGGCVAYLNTNDFRDVLKLSEEGNKEAQLIYDAFIYQVAKEIGAMATVLEGNVDKIILTGGMAYSEKVVGDITKRVGWISEVKTYPGEDELLALAQGAIRVLDGEEKAKEY